MAELGFQKFCSGCLFGFCLLRENRSTNDFSCFLHVLSPTDLH